MKYLIRVLTKDFQEQVKRVLAEAVQNLPMDYQIDAIETLRIKLRILYLNPEWEGADQELRTVLRPILTPKFNEVVVEPDKNEFVLVNSESVHLREYPIISFEKWNSETEARYQVN